MRYPPYIAEMASEGQRRNIRLSVTTGYLTAGFFALLLIAAQVLGFIPWGGTLHALVALKLATNTLQWICLRLDRGVLEAGGLNMTADLVAMTGAIYLTGGVLSPLVPIYLIEITIVALLTNLGITILITSLAIALFSGMILLVHTGVLPAVPPPISSAEEVTTSYVIIAIGYVAFALGLPTVYVASILQRLREKSRALERRTAELVEAQRTRAQLVANVTHELRTPIHGIQGLSDLIAAGVYGPATAEQKDASAQIKESARSLLRLVDDLLQLAAGEAEKQEVRLADHDVGEMVTHVVGAARPVLGGKTLRMESDVAPDLPAVRTDRAKLVQVLLNLVINAVKFTPDGGTVTVRARRDADRIAVAVVDTGVGIAPEDLPRVFEPFWQAAGTEEERLGGAGLGLAVVKSLCERLGAEITVESTPSRGSTFTVTLPLATPA